MACLSHFLISFLCITCLWCSFVFKVYLKNIYCKKFIILVGHDAAWKWRLLAKFYRTWTKLRDFYYHLLSKFIVTLTIISHWLIFEGFLVLSQKCKERFQASWTESRSLRKRLKIFFLSQLIESFLIQGVRRVCEDFGNMFRTAVGVVKRPSECFKDQEVFMFWTIWCLALRFEW